MLAATSCVGRRSPAVYQGSSVDGGPAPADVWEAPVLPVGYKLLGQVRSECALTEGRSGIDDEWLSDVDCTRWRLTEALRFEAAENGGEVLVGRICLAARRVGERVVIRCEALVARAEEGRPPLIGSPQPLYDTLRLDDASGVEAWRIRVHFEPHLDPAARAPRRIDSVEEVSVLPLTAQRLGALQSTCERAPCSVEAVRAGLRVAAGRLGATHVGEIRCVSADERPRCLGQAALLEELPSSYSSSPQ